MAVRLLPKQLIGQGIRRIRSRMGLTQAELASSLGVADADQVGRWERGEAQPEYTVLAKLATMGLVDVLVSPDAESVSAVGSLTPGEAAELRSILQRMEALLEQAKQVVERASRHAVASAEPPLPELTVGVGLAVTSETKGKAASRAATSARKTAGAKKSGTAGKAKTAKTSSARGGRGRKTGPAPGS